MPRQKKYVRVTAVLIAVFIFVTALAGVGGVIKNMDIPVGPADVDSGSISSSVSVAPPVFSDESELPPTESTEQPQPNGLLPENYRAVWVSENDYDLFTSMDSVIVTHAEGRGITAVILDVSAQTSAEKLQTASAYARDNGIVLQINLTFVPEDYGSVINLIGTAENLATVFLPDTVDADSINSLREALKQNRIYAGVGIATSNEADGILYENADAICLYVNSENAEDLISGWSEALTATDIPLFTAFSVDSKKAEDNPMYLAQMQGLTVNAVNYRGTVIKNAVEMYFDKTGAVTALLASLNGKGEAVFDTALKITEPVETEYSTYGETFTFRGTANPIYELTVNGEKVPISENGGFIWTTKLVAGDNIINVSYLNQSVTFKVKRKIDVINRINPSKDISVNGGTLLTITAKALFGSELTATLNGEKLTFTRDDDYEYDDENGSGGYAMFYATFEVPEATEKEQNLGKIRFKGTYEGYTESVSSGVVKVNAYVAPSPPADNKINTVEITASHLDGRNFTKTYNPQYSDDNSDPTQYFLATGMIEEIVGEVTANGEDGPVDCYLLSSGVLIHKEDCKLIKRDKIKNNISSAALSEDGRYTVIRFTASEPVAVLPVLSPLEFTGKHPKGYNIDSFEPTAIELIFTNTVAKSDILGFANNKMFSTYKWEKLDDNQYKLVLTLKEVGGFYGIKTEIDSKGRIVVSFKNPVSLKKASNEYGYSLDGIRVVVDAGHNGNYPLNVGAAGFLDGLHECHLNLMLAEKTKERLEALGAEVILTRDNNDCPITKDERVAAIISSNADLCISIHHNGSDYEKLYGMSTYYFYPFSKDFSQSVYKEMLKTYKNYMYPEGSGKTDYDHGCRYYPYYMTRIQEFPCILVEAGHITNRKEYDMLIDDEIQNHMADSFTDGIVNYLISQQ